MDAGVAATALEMLEIGTPVEVANGAVEEELVDALGVDTGNVDDEMVLGETELAVEELVVKVLDELDDVERRRQLQQVALMLKFPPIKRDTVTVETQKRSARTAQ